MNDVTLSKVFRKVGRDRGRDKEDRFLKLFRYCTVPPGFPDWFHGICGATQEEDCRGIDAIAFTDVGKIFLQIKSSSAGVEKFKKQQEQYPERKWSFPIIVRDADSDTKILEKTRAVLSQARQTILNHRNHSN